MLTGKATKHVKTPIALSEIRRCQRAHAKLRFEQRFALQMNRDRIHEIERKIASGQVVLVERRLQVRNYLVEVQGELIAVGYNTLTKRVVTALPESYRQTLPAQLVYLARVRLLGDTSALPPEIEIQEKHFEGIQLDEATCRKMRERVRSGGSIFLWRYNDRIAFHEANVGGVIHRFGYNSKTKKLYRYEEPDRR